MPAFCFVGGPAGKLPDPGVPFGLHLGYYAGNRPSVGWLPRNPVVAPLTDVEMKRLHGLKSLTRLWLYSFSLTDAGMKELGSLHGLTSLDLIVPLGVTGAGLQFLEPLDKLTSLDLSHTQVTDAGLDALPALHRLTVLNLSGTKTTEEGLARLQKCLPRCQIAGPR